MKDYEIKVLDENDHIFIETLRNLGMSRNVATTMAYLMNVDEASSREIEISTGLRQPEVSLAMRLMRNQSWVSVRSEKKPGKGRPIKIYSLAAPVDEIISYYEDRDLQRVSGNNFSNQEIESNEQKSASHSLKVKALKPILDP